MVCCLLFIGLINNGTARLADRINKADPICYRKAYLDLSTLRLNFLFYFLYALIKLGQPAEYGLSPQAIFYVL